MKLKLYVFGNGNLPFRLFVAKYTPTLLNAVAAGYEFIVCDYRGVDTLTMEYLKTRSPHVTVYHMLASPRYWPSTFLTQASDWLRVGGFESDRERDDAAIKACTHFLAHDINSDDGGKSGTLRNIERCLEFGKERLGVL
jgi:hypothetical protein